MMRWIADRSNGVEPPIRRLIAILIDRGDDALGPARNILLNYSSLMTRNLQKKGHENFPVSLASTRYS